MYYFNQIFLRCHYGVDILVGVRNLINHRRIFTAFHTLRGCNLVIDRKPLLRCGSRHDSARAVAATAIAVGVAQSANNERSRAHAAWNDTQLTASGAHSAFAGNEHLLTEMHFLRDVDVMAVYGGLVNFEGNRHLLAQRLDSILHHDFTVNAGEILRPANRVNVVIKVVGPFLQIGEVAIRQLDLQAFHILERALDEVGADGARITCDDVD